MSFKPLNKAINPYAFPGIAFDLVGGKKDFYIAPDEVSVANVVTESILEVFNLTMTNIRERNRITKVRQCRQFIHYFLRKYTNLSLASIGGDTRRDHATVLHSCRTVEKDLETVQEVQNYYKSIESKIKDKAKKKGVKLIKPIEDEAN